MAEGQAINNDSRIVELLELLANNQMNAQAEQSNRCVIMWEHWKSK